MSIEANIRRIKVDPADDYQSLTNKVTGGVVYIPRGRDVDLEFGYYERGIFQANPSFLTTITAEVRPFTNRGGTALVVANTSIINSISEGEWTSDTNQHFTITLPAAQTASLSVADETDYWLVVCGFTATGKCITLISGHCKGVNDAGNYSAAVPTPGDPTFVTSAQLFSALAALGGGGGTVSNGKRLTWVWDTTDQLWTQNTTDA